MLEDLTMLANLPVVDAEATDKAKAESDKAAASETMPPPRRTRRSTGSDTKAARVARRGQDPPEHEKASEEDR